MNKIAAVIFALGAFVLIAVGGWGLVYVPAKMEVTAKLAIRDFNRVLARRDSLLSLKSRAIVSHTDSPLDAATSLPL